jgi:four helix bundle protein
MHLVEEVYRLTRAFPRREVYGLASQMQRAAVSIPANIAEGHNRRHRKEFLHHIAIAQASLAEVETHAETSRRLHYVTPAELAQFLQRAVLLGRQLHALRKALSTPVLDPRSPTP